MMATRLPAHVAVSTEYVARVTTYPDTRAGTPSSRTRPPSRDSGAASRARMRVLPDETMSHSNIHIERSGKGSPSRCVTLSKKQICQRTVHARVHDRGQDIDSRERFRAVTRCYAQRYCTSGQANKAMARAETAIAPRAEVIMAAKNAADGPTRRVA